MRERAEKELETAKVKDNITETNAELVHELQVHQTELQMQNRELRETQEDLAKLYHEYHELYNEAPIGYFSLDKNGNIRNVNIKGTELLGLEKERIISRVFIRFIQKKYRNDYFNALNHAINNNENQEVEIQLNGHGVPFYVHMEIMPVFNKYDEMYRITIIDISSRKKAEEELRLAHEKLEEKVKKRTIELKEAIDALKHSNEELQQFAYVTSHDLQEPLRTIASFTQLLERRYKGKLDSDADEFMDFIVDAAVRMKEQIEGLLNYSRTTTQLGEFDLVDTNEILNQTIKILDTSIKEAYAEITHDKLPVVNGDAKQLQRVFQNLISNAIKFKKCEEPLKVHISFYKADDRKEYVFTVNDNGIGIEEEYYERIFKIFQRLHTRDEYQGIGIGLSIIKRIIERHGGHIWVESEFGVGTTFYFTIPIKR